VFLLSSVPQLLSLSDFLCFVHSGRFPDPRPANAHDPLRGPGGTRDRPALSVEDPVIGHPGAPAGGAPRRGGRMGARQGDPHRGGGPEAQPDVVGVHAAPGGGALPVRPAHPRGTLRGAPGRGTRRRVPTGGTPGRPVARGAVAPHSPADRHVP